MTRLGFLTRYGVDRASSRVRAYQVSDALARYGLDCMVMSQASDRTLLGNQIEELSSWADAIVLHKPDLTISQFERLGRRAPIIIDIDDAIWLPDSRPSIVRKATGYWPRFRRRLARMLNRSAAVVCGNPTLADWAHERGVARAKLKIIPPCIADLYIERHDVHMPANPDKLRVGWIGSQGNLKDLKLISRDLDRLVKNYDDSVEICVCSSHPPSGIHVDRFVRWSPVTEHLFLDLIDIGLMPMFDNERSRGRCGYKALQYMVAWTPVLASGVPGPSDVVLNRITGRIVDPRVPWSDVIVELMADRKALVAMGKAARSHVVEGYSMDVAVSAWLDVLEFVL